MKNARLIIAVLLVILSGATQVKTQDSISAGKKALIRELLEVTEARNTAEKVLDVILLQMEKDMPKILMQTATQDPKVMQMSVQEQAALKKYIDESSVRIGNRFRELAPQRLNYAETIEQISYSVYDKFFTEAELKDLIVFYGTSTGKKSIRVMPQLMAESMQRFSGIAMPKIQQLITEITEEEMKHFRK